MAKQPAPKRRSLEARALTRLRSKVKPSGTLYERQLDVIANLMKTHGMTLQEAIKHTSDGITEANRLADHLGFD